MGAVVQGRFGSSVTVRQSTGDVLLVAAGELYGFAPAQARELAAALRAAAAEAERAEREASS